MANTTWNGYVDLLEQAQSSLRHARSLTAALNAQHLDHAIARLQVARAACEQEFTPECAVCFNPIKGQPVMREGEMLDDKCAAEYDKEQTAIATARE